MPVAIKRVYEKPSRSDGTRVLVDRLWPRGLSKEDAVLDAWLRDLAPSDNLRKWYHENGGAWEMFRRRYLKELTVTDAAESLDKLYELAGKRKRLTLLYSSRNQVRNNAVVLKELKLEEGMRLGDLVEVLPSRMRDYIIIRVRPFSETNVVI